MGLFVTDRGLRGLPTGVPRFSTPTRATLCPPPRLADTRTRGRACRGHRSRPLGRAGAASPSQPGDDCVHAGQPVPV